MALWAEPAVRLSRRLSRGLPGAVVAVLCAAAAAGDALRCGFLGAGPSHVVDFCPLTLYHSHCTPERSKRQAQRMDTANLPKSFTMKSRIC